MQWDCIDMKGQVVLITGSSSGIGRETAYRFAQTGTKIVLSYNKRKARGEQAENGAEVGVKAPCSFILTSQMVKALRML
jgi:NAD(P)-dependent dehydrogenase (short-subunit alcohol dehydrogenase family)